MNRSSMTFPFMSSLRYHTSSPCSLYASTGVPRWSVTMEYALPSWNRAKGTKLSSSKSHVLRSFWFSSISPFSLRL